MVHKLLTLAAALAVAIALSTTTASAQQLSGAIFTTDASGEPVNLNIYDAKEDVHLNGGPGLSAPDDAAGLPDGTYYFQVTDPSGKTLLSTDEVGCRQFTVVGGVITGVVAAGGCEHATGTDGEDGGSTVQLMPYADTPNNGGVYKVWVTPVEAYDCAGPGNKHCFVPADSKTDNFKVRAGAIVEIDTRFSGSGGQYLLGMKATWIDTLGASNVKFSEYKPEILAFYEAHVEAAEPGLHQIVIDDQPGCVVEYVHTPTGEILYPTGGSVTVPLRVKNHNAGDMTYFVDVHCMHD